MNLDDVMQAVADRLDTITGLTCYAYPPDDTPSLPAAWCDWPEQITFDQTMGRGEDVMTLPIGVAVERIEDKAAWQKLAPFCDGSGTSSVKAVLESGEYTAFDYLRVQDVQFVEDSISGTPVLAALFNVEIVGSGA